MSQSRRVANVPPLDNVVDDTGPQRPEPRTTPRAGRRESRSSSAGSKSAGRKSRRGSASEAIAQGEGADELSNGVKRQDSLTSLETVEGERWDAQLVETAGALDSAAQEKVAHFAGILSKCLVGLEDAVTLTRAKDMLKEFGQPSSFSSDRNQPEWGWGWKVVPPLAPKWQSKTGAAADQGAANAKECLEKAIQRLEKAQENQTKVYKDLGINMEEYSWFKSMSPSNLRRAMSKSGTRTLNTSEDKKVIQPNQPNAEEEDCLKKQQQQQDLLDHVNAEKEDAEKEARAAMRRFMAQVLDMVEFKFFYKHRKHSGQAIHIAALYGKDKGDLIKAILQFDLRDEAQAEVEAGEASATPRPERYGLRYVQKIHTSKANGKLAGGVPLHLAAGCGNVPALKALIESRANVNEKTVLFESDRGVVKHYTALHEAAFFQMAPSVKYLLEARAEPNCTNRYMETPLHISAQQGAYQVAEALVIKKARVDMPAKTSDGSEGETAVEMAVDCGNFPVRKLFLLTNRSVKDVLTVAQVSPRHAAALVQDRNGAVHPSWRFALMDDRHDVQALKLWIELMRLAPEAAEDLIEAATMPPNVDNKDHHPLPKQAALRPAEVMRCRVIPDKPFCDHWRAPQSTILRPSSHSGTSTFLESMEEEAEADFYLPGLTWQHCAECPKAVPEWHQQICPKKKELRSQGEAQGHIARLRSGLKDGGCGCVSVGKKLNSWLQGRTMMVQTKMKVVAFKNFMSMEVLLALKETHYLHVFTKLAIRALIQTAWDSSVRQFYYWFICIRVFEVLVLFIWVLGDLDQQSVFFGDSLRRACWSFLFVSALRESSTVISEVIGYAWMEHLGSYLFSFSTVVDLISIGLLLALTIVTWQELDSIQSITYGSSLLALTVFFRWLQLMYAFRAFPKFGKKLLPIIHSVTMLGGIFAFCLFGFMAFLHAFVALDFVSSQRQCGSVVHKVLQGGDLSLPGIIDVCSQETAGAPQCELFAESLEPTIARLDFSPATFCAEGRHNTKFHQHSLKNIFVSALRFLLIGDGDGIDTVLELGGATKTGNMSTIVALLFATMAFSIITVNLFIAGIDQAYEQAQELSHAQFEQQRAMICLHCLFRPSIELPRWLQWGQPQNIVLAFTTFFVLPVWAVSMTFPEIPAVVPSVFLFVATYMGDAVIMQRPWEPERAAKRRNSYRKGAHWSPESSIETIPSTATRTMRTPPPDANFLWICHRADFDEVDYWPSECSTMVAPRGDGRVASLKRDAMLRSRRVQDEMDSIKRRQGRLQERLRGDIQDVQDTMMSHMREEMNHMRDEMKNIFHKVRVRSNESLDTVATCGSTPNLSMSIGRTGAGSGGRLLT